MKKAIHDRDCKGASSLKHRITRSISLAAIVGSLGMVACDTSGPPRSGDAIPVDRSVASGSQTTAMDQSNSSEHIEITARIRRAVMDDDALSTGAKNATIVTDRNGTVTLRGDVGNQAEKDAIAAKAAAVVGAGRVVNQLVVKP